MRPPDHNGAPSASLGRRALALAYEALLLAAWLLAGAVPFVMLTQGMGSGPGRPLSQLYLVTIAGAYFIWQWRHGRTLAMKTWRLRLVAGNGMPLTWKRASLRFVFALPGTLLLGAGFLWALVDREQLFLHDRLAGTRIINC